MTAIKYDTTDTTLANGPTSSTADLTVNLPYDDPYAGLNRAQRRAAIAKESRAWRKQQKRKRRNG